MNVVRRITVIALFVILIALLAGCQAQIFEEKEPEKVVSRYSKEELEDGGFYIKDGTAFYRPYKADSGFSASTSSVNSTRIYWMEQKEDEMIPVLYRGEVFAFVSSTATPSKFSVERFKDCGYSVGIRGFAPVRSGQLLQYTASVSNLKEGSNAYELFSGISAQKLTVADVDGRAVDGSSFTYGGVLAGMEYGQTYSLGIYVGSFHKEHKVMADTRVLASDSILELSDISLTRNGYYAVQIPDEWESGYYYAEPYGFFKYINEEKHPDLKIDVVDWNKSLKTTSSDRGMSKTVHLTRETNLESDFESLNIKIQVKTTGRVIDSASVVLPSGEEETILAVEGIYAHTINDAVKGTYQVKLHGTGVETDYQVSFEPVGDKTEAALLTEESAPVKEGQTETNPQPSGEISTQGQNEQSSPQYEWIMKFPEPLNEAEVSDTQATE